MADLSPYQQKIIKRYYNNYDSIQSQRLAELVTEIYLAEGKKLDRLWARVGEMLTKLEFPASRIEHLLDETRPGPPRRGDAGTRRQGRLKPRIADAAHRQGRGSRRAPTHPRIGGSLALPENPTGVDRGR